MSSSSTLRAAAAALPLAIRDGSDRVGRRAAELLDRLRDPGELNVFTRHDVLIGVVGVVLTDQARRRLMPEHHRQLLAVELLQQWKQVGHEFCFSLQVMQTRVHGMAFNRASAIGSPQSRHNPYEPFSMRQSASSMAWRIFASVAFNFS